MNSENKIREYLIGQKYTVPADDTYSHIDEWLEWYQNDVEKFHHYKLYNGRSERGWNGTKERLILFINTISITGPPL